MLDFGPHHDHWQLLTPENVAARRLWAWGYSIQQQVSAGEPRPRDAGELLIASDFGGEHAGSSHLVYCYLVIRGGFADWSEVIRDARAKFLRDGRTMSYKKLGDPMRQQALISFLAAAANLDGHLVAVAVDKKKKWLSTAPDVADDFRQSLGLRANWNPRAFEAMARKVHLAGILISLWARPYTNVTWITDEDAFVANEVRHDDALLAAARFSSFYSPFPMGVYRLNTTGQDPAFRDYEDLCAIPDLAAGMLSEISTRLSKVAVWEDRMRRVLDGGLPTKTEIIADWFWDVNMPLRKSLISIDVEGERYGVRKIWMVEAQEDTAPGETSPSRDG
ncbi:hypothetical protein A7X12_23380 [Sphingomonas sp. TDK1]|nr:hypothetical protein A7X12_23380 [Sphingomonas sp. TDK1]